MAKRRGNGDGTIRQRKDGSWEYIVSAGETQDGKAKRKSFYGKTKKEAKEKYRAWVESGSKNTPIESVRTVRQWALHWLEIYKKGKVSIDTYEQYKGIVDKYIIPTIGGVKIKEVKPAHIQMMMNKYEDKSASHLTKLRMVVNAIFESAIDNDYCDKNPCRNIRPASKTAQNESEYFTDTEVDTILNYCLNRRGMASMGIFILLHTGLRPEELLGLMHGDIDFENGVIRVNRTVVDIKGRKQIKESMKNESSRRSVPLLPSVADFIKSEKKSSLYILHTKDNDYYSPGGFRKIYQTFFKALNASLSEPDQVRPLTPHKCRHTFATRLLNSGVNIKVVQSVLGHSDISTTGNVYVHSDIDTLKRALNGFKYN